MDQIMDITDDMAKMTENDKSVMLKNLDKLGFSPTPGISITPSEIVNKESSTETLDTTISNVLKQYNEKLGTKFEYKDYKASLMDAVSINANEKEIRKLIDGQIITNIAEILTTKAVLVISKVISDQLDRIANITQGSGLNAEIISMVSEMFGWVEKLEEIKAKFQTYDSESKIKSLLSNQQNLNNLVRTPEQEQVLDSLKKLLIMR